MLLCTVHLARNLSKEALMAGSSNKSRINTLDKRRTTRRAGSTQINNELEQHE
jgi:hypothetical protein